MDQKPEVSVIVPVWNSVSYLPQAVGSVLSQTFDNWELILIDDGSTDGSGALCSAYAEKDPRIRVIRQDNRGPSEARNTGLKHASGTFLQFLDSDDWLDPEALKTLKETADTTGADMVIFDVIMEGEDYSWAQPSVLPEGIYTAEFILEKLAANLIPPFAVNKFCRRERYDGVFFPAGEKWEDAATTFYPISGSERIAVITKPFYHYRQRENSLSKTALQDNSVIKWRFLQYRKRYEFLRENFPRAAEAAKFSVLHYGIRYYTYFIKDKHGPEAQEVYTYVSGKHLYDSNYGIQKKTEFFLFKHFPVLSSRILKTIHFIKETAARIMKS